MVLIAIAVALALMVMALPVMWLWNYLMPGLFGLAEIGYWQALVLNIILGYCLINIQACLRNK